MPSVKSSMRQKTHRHRAVWRLGFALTLALSLCLMSPSLASAQDFNPKDYFQLSYDPVTLDKTEINGGEVFHATIAGRATCTKDLPMSVSEATIKSMVVAEHTISGVRVTLNSSYTVTIKPFPSKKDETAEISQAVPLQFPAQAESGDYNVIGKIVEAKVKVGIIPIPVTDYFSQDQQMGTVKYTASESAAPASASAPPPTPISAPAPTPAPPEPIITWWGELIVLIAVATTVFNIVWFLRHRRR